MTFWSSPSSALPKHLILFPPAQELSRRARCADRSSAGDSFEIYRRYFLPMIAMPFTSFGSVVPHPFPSRTSFGLSRYHRLEPCRGPSNGLHQPELILTGHVRGPLQRHPPASNPGLRFGLTWAWPFTVIFPGSLTLSALRVQCKGLVQVFRSSFHTVCVGCV
jgi:hypothetical protein